MKKGEIYALLKEEGIPFEALEHPAVLNMEDLEALRLSHPEREGKNLFLRDGQKKHYYLLTVRGEKRVDLKAFQRDNGLKHLSFASPEELEELRGLEPGGVTPLGLLNDADHRTQFFLDRDLTGGLIGIHPNENMATIWLRTEDLLRLLERYGSAAQIISVPEREEERQ